MTEQSKRLIEYDLPLADISEASAREKNIRHGHPSTLHIWWARRPLASSRATAFAALIDDPGPDHPQLEVQQLEGHGPMAGRGIGGVERPGDDPRRDNRLEIVHVNELSGGSIATAHLLEFDSIHGRWRGDVAAGDVLAIRVDGNALDHVEDLQHPVVVAEDVLHAAATIQLLPATAALTTPRKSSAWRWRQPEIQNKASSSI